MRKTSVYLSDDEAEGLRALARSTGRSQAELIREGVRRLLDRRRPRRVFRSMGVGASGGAAERRWTADEVAGRLGVGAVRHRR
jgi:Arc/MetJ-type ribon-helix-helix transcriptional regulator